MFTEGQTVYHVVDTGKDIKGVVVDSDGSLVYIETATGVEMEFKAQDLVTEEEYFEKIEIRQAARSPKQPQKLDWTLDWDLGKTKDVDMKIYEDIERQFGPELMENGRIIHQHMTAIVKSAGDLGTVASWEDMNAYQRLNYIAVAFGKTANQFAGFYPHGIEGLKLGLMIMIRSKVNSLLNSADV